MEVRPGYKQTEVGVIPEDWEVEPLKRFHRGKCPLGYRILHVLIEQCSALLVGQLFTKGRSMLRVHRITEASKSDFASRQ